MGDAAIDGLVLVTGELTGLPVWSQRGPHNLINVVFDLERQSLPSGRRILRAGKADLKLSLRPRLPELR